MPTIDLLSLSGSISLQGSLTGSLQGTSSHAISASYAPSAPAAYNEYTVLLTHNISGFTVTQLTNTLGDGTNTFPNDIVWTNPDNAVIRATKTNAFTNAAKIWIPSVSFGSGTTLYNVVGSRSTSNFLSFAITRYDGNVLSTPYFDNLPITIRIYN